MESEAATHNKIMIAKPSIAFNDFAGTAKEVTARNVNGRNVLSVRAKQSKVVTPAQANSRNQLSRISREYKQLSDSQMRAWEVLAQRLKGISYFGKAAEMTGHNAFVRLNVNRSLAGEPILVNAPASVVSIPNASYRLAVVSPSMVVFQGIKHQPSPLKLVVKMSAAVSPGISNGWSKTVIISPSTEDDWGEADVTTFYTNTIGVTPSVGQKVFIEVYWMDTATGFAGAENRNSIICITDEEASALIGGSRVRYTEDNIKSTSTVSVCEMEFTTGAPVIYFDILSQGISGVSQSEIFPDVSIPPDVVGTSYVLSRPKSNDNFLFATNKVQIKKNTYYGDMIQFNPGKFQGYQDTEIFGVGVLV